MHYPLTAQRIVRYGWAALFLWFGFAQLTDAGTWVAYLPEWTGYFPIPGEMLVQINGWLEICAAVLLAIGLHTRIVAGILTIHLAGIALAVGGATGMRDGVLALMGLTIVLQEPDSWAADVWAKRA